MKTPKSISRLAEISRIYRLSGFTQADARRLAKEALAAETAAGHLLPIPLRAPFGDAATRRRKEDEWARLARAAGGRE